MSREEQINNATRDIWRNLPGYPSTFGPCANKCNSGLLGRGAGPCLRCASDALAGLVGKELAEKYVDAVRSVRDLEGQMVEPQCGSQILSDDPTKIEICSTRSDKL